MKISMIGPVYPYRGGIAHYTTSLVTALKNAGHDVKTISFRRQYPAFLYPGESDKDPSANPVRVEAEYLLDPIYPWTWQQAVRAILTSNSELVVIQWWTTFWAPAYAALAFQLKKKTQVVYLIHNVLPHENKFWDRWLARLALHQAHAFIVQAPHEQKKLVNLIPHARISYCNLPVYQQFSEQTISRDMARQQLGLPTDRPIFLFFGIVRPYKGLKYLIEALKFLNVPAHLVIAGEFWENVELYENQIRRLGLIEKITLIDRYIPNEEAHILFSAADVLVAPYIGGTQSAAVGVSLGYGLPAIVTEKIATGVEPGASSLHIVPAGDAFSLAQAMLGCISSPPRSTSASFYQDDWRRLVKVIEDIHFIPS
jgi:glycosyltransferase involved in cell wall biosynthesis